MRHADSSGANWMWQRKTAARQNAFVLRSPTRRSSQAGRRQLVAYLRGSERRQAETMNQTKSRLLIAFGRLASRKCSRNLAWQIPPRRVHLERLYCDNKIIKAACLRCQPTNQPASQSIKAAALKWRPRLPSLLAKRESVTSCCPQLEPVSARSAAPLPPSPPPAGGGRAQAAAAAAAAAHPSRAPKSGRHYSPFRAPD